MTVLAFTGHRPGKLFPYGESPEKNLICSWLARTIATVEPEYAISGMALGVDQWAANVCVQLDIPFIAAVPCDGQESKWPDQSKTEYHRLLNLAKEVKVISPGPYTNTCMDTRNIWMVDHCDVLAAVWTGQPGGTCNCVMYAKKVDKPIERLKWF